MRNRQWSSVGEWGQLPSRINSDYNLSEDCEATEHYRRTAEVYGQGRPDWETVTRHYGGEGWLINTPTSLGKVMTGPVKFPVEYLPFPQVITHNLGIGSGSARELTVVNSQGQPVHNALVALYTTPQSYTVAIDQGLTDALGHITVYDAAPGDF